MVQSYVLQDGSKNGLKAQKFLAQGIALGIMAISKAPLQGVNTMAIRNPGCRFACPGLCACWALPFRFAPTTFGSARLCLNAKLELYIFFKTMRKIDLIIVHCAATPEGKDFTIDDIDRWHRQQGFSSIGYHFVVYRDGSVHTGRPIEQVGAHCRGRNATSIGVCYIGGLSADGKQPKDSRTDKQKKALKALLTILKFRFTNAENGEIQKLSHFQSLVISH